MDAAAVIASIQGNTTNGYNEVERESVMNKMKGCGNLDETIVFIQTHP